MSELRSIDPSTGDVVGRVQVTPVERIPDVVRAARQAQPGWRELGLEARIAALAPLADRLDASVDELGTLMAREMGKPLREARGEVRFAASMARAMARQFPVALASETVTDEHTLSVLHWDPFGVAACITPWNFPVLMPHEQIVPALVAGNAVVFKPSEETPLVGDAYASLLTDLVPDGVLQVVHGDEQQGRALVHSDVDLIAFTGSRAAGRSILAAASGELKRVVLELGGKDPLIVLDDADMALAAKFAARASFANCGQVCTSTERIYVTERMHDAFVDALLGAARRWTVGQPTADGVRVGPMVNERQRAHVAAQVARAVSDGATVAFRAPAPEGDTWFGPVVLTDVTQHMDIARDETFGPVASVIRVASQEEAIRLANDTEYGLGAVVFGETEHARSVARRLDAGMVGINRDVGGAEGTPWVGARQSGYGFHSGVHGHRQFAQVRVVSEPRALDES